MPQVGCDQKRIQVTTELREYWICVAKYDPNAVRSMTQSVLGFEPAWKTSTGPLQLSEERVIAFSTLVAGHGNDGKLVAAGVPAQPTGRLNTDNALFMTHPINGLDDLLYIVMFGAKPYASRTANGLEQATREQLFREFSVQHLACHADPNAALGALGAAFNVRPSPLITGHVFSIFHERCISVRGTLSQIHGFAGAERNVSTS